MSDKNKKAPLTDEKAVQPHYDDLVDKDVEATGNKPGKTAKSEQLDHVRADGYKMGLTTNLGVTIADNQNSLKAGSRGPALREDFHFHEKLAHFDRERIPERVVHARASGAHGYFQVYKSLAHMTKAAFLQDPKVKTPVFVRLSTVQGFRGSPDTVRDIRGFATKFYTSEGNFDLVGNDTPVFFIQDAIKFPDFVHAVKPEPHNEVPQGQSAHDSFWDYVSLQPETLHNVMWAMSDRGIPRSLRMLEGFGIHTFRMIDADGKSTFVRFHWKPVYGKASFLWDEAQLITGRDPDFHRKDLWEAIEKGDYPAWELGLQIIPEEDERKFDFDILDPTKLIPEALVPVEIVGKMTLDRNPDNFFAETEQIAFCPANIVPGIDFSDDPLLQGRIFSYKDAQMHRLGTANFNELPINRPVCPVHNHQRDGFFRTQIDKGANYEPNSISGNWPREMPASPHGGGFESFMERLADISKVRERSSSFNEYFSHPHLFWLSQTPVEQKHIIGAFSFELSKVMRPYIRERVVDLLCFIDHDLANGVAVNLGITLSDEQLSRKVPGAVNGIVSDPTLSLYANSSGVVKSRKVAILAACGASGKSIEMLQKAFEKAGIYSQILAPHMGVLETSEGKEITIDGTIGGTPSVLFDAVVVADGVDCLKVLTDNGDAKYFLAQAYKHLKVLGFQGASAALLKAAGIPESDDKGVLTGTDNLVNAFIEAMKKHRIWAREERTTAFPA